MGNIPGAGGRKQGGGKGSAAGPRKGSAQKPRTSPRKSGGGGGRKQRGGGGEVASCPGEELQACIDVCPGFNARVFGACVAGCAKRCAKYPSQDSNRSMHHNVPLLQPSTQKHPNQPLL